MRSQDCERGLEDSDTEVKNSVFLGGNVESARKERVRWGVERVVVEWEVIDDEVKVIPNLPRCEFAQLTEQHVFLRTCIRPMVALPTVVFHRSENGPSDEEGRQL
jgi:hypothetical protein